jgi:plasmid segregation protein ParM
MISVDCGFDFGNSVAKGAIFNGLNLPQYCGVPSVTAEGTLAELNDIRQAAGIQQEYRLHDQDYVLAHNGAELYLGRLAFLYSTDTQETRGDINRYWSESALQFLLTISGSLVFDAEYSLNLVTGLPAQTYDAINRRRVRDALQGDHVFFLNGVRRRASVHVSRVVQEGAGGIILYGTQEPVKQSVIDIGGRTVDIFTARGQEPVRDQCKGYPKGVEDATDQIAEYAQMSYERLLTIAERRAILQAFALGQQYPDIAVKGRSLPVADMEAWAAAALKKTGALIRTFVSKTLRSSEKGGVATDLKSVWIIGGGAHYFLNDIQQIIPFAQVRPQPEYANALSYAYFARHFSERSGQARMGA